MNNFPSLDRSKYTLPQQMGKPVGQLVYTFQKIQAARWKKFSQKIPGLTIAAASQCKHIDPVVPAVFKGDSQA